MLLPFDLVTDMGGGAATAQGLKSKVRDPSVEFTWSLEYSSLDLGFGMVAIHLLNTLF